jgi:CheY-like chemotaxis protein
MQATANVLTVEDDPIVRADLRLVLEDAGFSVCPGARDGVEAVELAREHEPDVILLDLGLPRVDGVEVTRRILAERSVPIVALTGRSGDAAERAVEAGVTSYVLKPCADGEIVQALHDALASPKAPLCRRGAGRAQDAPSPRRTTGIVWSRMRRSRPNDQRST